MKVLTVRQPWAHLIIHGGKDIENRDWSTSVRGRVAIHSSARLDMREVYSAAELLAHITPGFAPNLGGYGYSCFVSNSRQLPLGSIIGTVEIVDCVRHSDSPWFMGEYGFVLRNPIALPEPIKVRGQLGWWDYPLESVIGGPHA